MSAVIVFGCWAAVVSRVAQSPAFFFEGSRFTDEALECAISQFFYFLNPFKIPSAIGIIFACLEKVSKHRVHFAPVWQL